MKKRLVKHYFNMVEIALALAVLAIGLSSILVLFPVGINANKSAIADNNLADIGEYLMGYLRAGCFAEWAKIARDREETIEAGGTPGPLSESDFFFSGQIPTGYNNVSSIGTDAIELSDYEGSTGRITENLYQLSGSQNSGFLYKQMSGDIVDFAAVVRVWREPYSFFALNASNNEYSPVTVNPGTYGDDSVNLYATVLCVEVSWPAQAPDAQRERRLFRQEIFNEAFRWTE